MARPPQSDAASGVMPLDTSGGLFPRQGLSRSLPSRLCGAVSVPAVTRLGREGTGPRCWNSRRGDFGSRFIS